MFAPAASPHLPDAGIADEISTAEATVITGPQTFDDDGGFTGTQTVVAIDGDAAFEAASFTTDRPTVLVPAEAAGLGGLYPGKTVVFFPGDDPAEIPEPDESDGPAELLLAGESFATTETVVLAPGEVLIPNPDEWSPDTLWSAVDTAETMESDGTVTFTATSPGLSDFAIGVAQPVFVVGEITFSATAVGVGDTVQLSVPVVNAGATGGTYLVQFRTGEAGIGSTTVRLDADASRTVNFDHVFTTPGEYDLAVNGEVVGTVEVSAVGTPTPTAPLAATPDVDAPTDAERPSPMVSTELPGFGMLVAVLALLAAAGLAARRSPKR